MKGIGIKACELFRDYLINTEKAAATVEKYTHDVAVFRIWLGTRQLNKSAVLAYKAELISRYAPASVNAALASLNAFFAFADRQDCKVKAVKIQRQLFAKEERELTKEEYERLLAAAEQKSRRLWLAMQAICSTGIRISELKFITVEAAQRGEATVRNKGKTRRALMPRELCRTLLRYARENHIRGGSVFVTRNGKPLDRSNVWAEMKALCASAGVDAKKAFPHNLRHLFARTYYRIHKDVARLADLLGHASVNTTRIYTAENAMLHKRQIERLGLLKC